MLENLAILGDKVSSPRQPTAGEIYWTTVSPDTNVNVVIGNKWNYRDIDIVFNVEGQQQRWLFYTDRVPTLGIILRDAGFIKSRGEAKRNGWDLEIEPGYSEFLYGKKPPFGIFIYMPLETLEEYILAIGHWPGWEEDRHNDSLFIF